MSEVRNLIIVGSGPAGYTAAVYAARANLRPLIIEGVSSGGALMTTTEVENFPGFPDGVMGPELMDNMRKQAEHFGAEFITDDVTRVELNGGIKIVYVGETAYRARAVILSTGSAWRPLNVPGEQELLGHGVSSCATCDGFFFRGKDIVVVGGGDSAMEEATFLTKFASKVTVIHRRDELRASKILQERLFANPKIEVIWNTIVESVEADDRGLVNNLKVRNVVAVSHYYHLARIKLTARRMGIVCATSPCPMYQRLAKEPYYIARECAAFATYYLFRA